MTLSLGSHTTSTAGTSTGTWVYPEVDTRLPPQVQWKFDYLAPEYALDSILSPANDLYSLGCLLYAVHLGGSPPFKTHNSMQGLRQCVERELVTERWKREARFIQAGQELKDILSKLITRTPQTRLSLAGLPAHPYFSSLAISTLNFLDAANFASKSREEKATFLKGLLRVLPGFSEKLRRRKLLPGLLDEVHEFAKVLPKLRPLFGLKDSPQNLVALLEHLQLFKEKTTPQQFKEGEPASAHYPLVKEPDDQSRALDVMPLIYNSLECDHPQVQEKALKAIPAFCEALPYDILEQVLLVKVAVGDVAVYERGNSLTSPPQILFTKTRILSVKVCTLECFLSMVPILTQSVLTQKLVPLLAKIRTKEPTVMMATLNVHEAMGMKVDREAVAGLVLPQLWTMSMGPLLNVDQFSKFMSVIKSLGARVEREHIDHLRSVRHAEAQTASLGMQNSGWELGHEATEVDFETLVDSASAPVPASIPPPSIPQYNALPPLVPTPRKNGMANGIASQGPNYNISLAPSSTPAGFSSASPSWSTSSPSFAPPIQHNPSLPPGFGSGILQPVVKPQWKPAPGKTTDWGDFDPLK
ncbi:hypothetical protein QFC19_002944 [Naganishia cerealis]|uniref:Uncharacterized protein n=1 Tax=Naganishia cerealis TaxID=610337 RepID=A0ACC2W883_9TREE|nr:hypothetical protein QFC19_002944 [Naganishia cerealis]